MAIASAPQPTQIVYPDSDEEPMADNTLQFEWITMLKFGLEALFADQADVFVAGDLLWYPVEGDNRTWQAPDVLVAFGRPRGYRGSYRQWEEGGFPFRWCSRWSVRAIGSGRWYASIAGTINTE